jgi:hypothetical protein
MNRRQWLKAAAFGAAWAAVGRLLQDLALGAPAGGQRLNIVLIMADDMGLIRPWWEIGSLLEPMVFVPNGVQGVAGSSPVARATVSQTFPLMDLWNNAPRSLYLITCISPLDFPVRRDGEVALAMAMIEP